MSSAAIDNVSESVAKVRRAVLPVLFVLAVLGLIELWVRLGHVSSAIMAPPSAIIETLIVAFPLLVEHAVHTGTEASAGFVLGSISGIVIALLMTTWQPLTRALYPNLVAFQLIPKIALAPLFMLWLGVGASSRIIFTIFLCFFPVMVATVAGMSAAPAYALKLSDSLRASKWQTFFLVRAPFAIPFIASGLKVSATLAMIGIVVGEFVTAQSGLGYIILFASSAGETRLLFAALILLCLEGLVLYGLVVLLGYFLNRWYGAPFEAPEGL